MGAPTIPPALFGFLRELKENNDRAWFKANRERYEIEVRDPMLNFIAAFAAPLAAVSPHFSADPRPNGGSLFRIYRDTRFSRDKKPYKTNVGAHFRHVAGKDAHAPGFYLHLEPERCFAGVGVWRPGGEAVGHIRDAMVARPAVWRRVTGGAFGKTFAMHGESLKRPPRGYDPGHPLIDDLKRKDFIAMVEFPESEAVRPDFLNYFAGIARTGGPFVRFLSEAVGVPF